MKAYEYDKGEPRLNPLWDDYPWLRPDLLACLNQMKHYLHMPDSEVEKEVRELLLGGGKMLRPALYYAFYWLCLSANAETAAEYRHPIAASLEFLHGASLFHDDIIDQASIRHGRPALHRGVGEEKAVYAGDYLLAQVFEIQVTHFPDHELLEASAACIRAMLGGELRQRAERWNFQLSERRYLKIIAGKTASLMALCCRCGAAAAGTGIEIQKKASDIGKKLGLAFQIQDDLLDWQGDPRKTKKNRYADIMSGYLTLPLLYAMREPDEELLATLREIKYGAGEEKSLEAAAALARRLERDGHIERSARKAEDYALAALNLLKTFPDSVARQSLITLIARLGGRES